MAIHDTDIATVFAIEAIGLVDHFNFRNKFGTHLHPANASIIDESTKASTADIKPLKLTTDSNWTNSYFSEFDTHCQERSLLA